MFDVVDTTVANHRVSHATRHEDNRTLCERYVTSTWRRRSGWAISVDDARRIGCCVCLHRFKKLITNHGAAQ